MYPHRIRLGPPWQRLEPQTPGHARWRRRFGHPRTVDAHEHLWIVWSNPPPGSSVWLNDWPLGTAGARPLEAPVDRAILLRNELVVELSRGQWLSGEVALEVRRAAYLRDVTVGPDSVSGELGGSAEADAEAGPFEVYVLAGGKTVGSVTLPADAADRPFRVECPGLTGPGRVELVKGGSVWFVWEGG